MALIAWWKLDGNAEDIIGGNDGNAVGTTDWINGKIGGAAEFGQTGYIEIGNLSNLNFQPVNSFSIGGWVKVTETFPTWHSSLGRWLNTVTTFFGRGSTGSSFGIGISTTWNDTGDPEIEPEPTNYRFLFGSRGVSQIYITDSYDFELNKWYHLFFVYTPGVQYGYVNGERVITRNNSAGIGGTFSGSWGVFAPRAVPGGNGRHSAGVADDLRIYNRALSIKEIKELSRAKVFHTKLNNPNSIDDDSGNDGEITNNGAVFSSESKIGSGSYEFDNNNIQTDWGENYTVDNNLTLSLWVKPSTTSGRQIFASFGTNTDNRRAYFSVYGGNWDMGIQGTAWGGGSQVANTDWTHIAIVFGETSVNMYTNTILTRSISYTSYDLLANLRLGQYGNGSYPFYGNIQDVKVFTQSLSLAEINEIYSQRGSIDNKGNLFAQELAETSHKPLIMDYTIWQDGQTGAQGPFGQYSSRNWRTIGTDPWGKETVVWEGESLDGSTAGTGIYFSTSNPIDNTKMYRLTFWERRVTNSDATYARYYFGLNGYGSTNGVYNRSTGALSTNPYFYNTSNLPTSAQLPEGEWVLFVGHIWPAGSGTGSTHPDSGRYTLNGRLGNISRDWVWHETSDRGRGRTLAIYQPNSGGVIHHSVYPRMDVVDGTEPSIAELLAGFDSNHIDYIRAKGGTKYISFDINSKLTYTGDISEVGPTQGLIGWWPLNGDTNDMSGEENHGINNNGVVVPGLKQLAYEFDGDGWIDLGDSLYLPDNHPFTLSGWVNYNSFSNRDMMLSRNDAVKSGSPYTWLLGTRDGDRMYAYDGSSWSQRMYSFSTGTWYHLTFRFDGTTMHYYVNGESIGTTSWSFSDSTTGRNTQIGGYSGTTGDIDGKTFDIRFYDRALSPEEIKILYDITKPGGPRVKKTKTGVYIKGEFVED